MSIEQILMIMDKLNLMHRSLLKLAYHKTEILQSAKVEGLDETMKNEQSHIAAISQLENQRQEAVEQFFKERQVTSAGVAVSDLMNYASEDEKNQLEEKRKSLLLTVTTLQNQNDMNQKLLFQSLQFVNLTLDLLRPQPDQINYSSTSGNRKSAMQGQFDSKA